MGFRKMGKTCGNFWHFCPIVKTARVFEFWELWITSGKTFQPCLMGETKTVLFCLTHETNTKT